MDCSGGGSVGRGSGQGGSTGRGGSKGRGGSTGQGGGTCRGGSKGPGGSMGLGSSMGQGGSTGRGGATYQGGSKGPGGSKGLGSSTGQGGSTGRGGGTSREGSMGSGGSMGLGNITGRGGGTGREGSMGPEGSMGLGNSTGRGGSISRGRGSFSKGRVSRGRGSNNGCGRGDETSDCPVSPQHYSSYHVSHGSSHQVSPNHTSIGVSHHSSLKNVSPGVSHHDSPSVSQYVSPDVSHNEGLDHMDTDDYLEEESSQHLEEDSNVVEQPPTNPSNRIEVWLLGEEFGDPKVGRKAVAILRSMYNGPWATWADVEPDYVGKLWRRFQKYFYWHPDIHEEVRHAWNKHMQLRFYNVTQGARAYATKKAFEDDGVVLEDDLSVLIPYHPKWTRHDHWVTLIEKKWNNTKWKKKSALNSKNRTTLVDGHMAKHSCGSVSIVQTKYRLEKKLGRKVTFIELLTYCHTKKGSRLSERDSSDNTPPEFVDPRAQYLLNDYATSYAEKHADEDVAEMMTDDVELWKECAGKGRKGLYGGGIRQDPSFVMTGVRSTQSSIGVSNSNIEQVHTLMATVERQQKEIEEQRALAEKATIAVEEQKVLGERQLKEMEEKLAAFTAMMLQNYPPPS